MRVSFPVRLLKPVFKRYVVESAVEAERARNGVSTWNTSVESTIRLPWLSMILPPLDVADRIFVRCHVEQVVGTQA